MKIEMNKPYRLNAPPEQQYKIYIPNNSARRVSKKKTSHARASPKSGVPRRVTKFDISLRSFGVISCLVSSACPVPDVPSENGESVHHVHHHYDPRSWCSGPPTV